MKETITKIVWGFGLVISALIVGFATYHWCHAGVPFNMHQWGSDPNRAEGDWDIYFILGGIAGFLFCFVKYGIANADNED